MRSQIANARNNMGYIRKERGESEILREYTELVEDLTGAVLFHGENRMVKVPFYMSLASRCSSAKSVGALESIVQEAVKQMREEPSLADEAYFLEDMFDFIVLDRTPQRDDEQLL